MKVFISGGCKNGKSSYAEKIAVKLAGTAPLYYVATMKAVDDEDILRIKKHRESRKGYNFETVEQATDINMLTDICDIRGTFLIDSVTALLANEMFGAGNINTAAGEKVAANLVELINIVDNIVIVSDYIYSDAEQFDKYTELYCRSLGDISIKCASVCDTVIEVCYTNMIIHKGTNPLESR